MRPAHLDHLCCIKCRGGLRLDARETDAQGVKEGALFCVGCGATYQIVRHIPRMLSGERNYSGNFGFQWNRHYRTQYDSYSGIPASAERFRQETRWADDLSGERLLEAGSGSGRFTEHAAKTGATVISFDYSDAVEANYRNNGHLENVLILQASIYEMPFRPASFEKVLCIGVIQHTPDPEQAFKALAAMLAPGGNIVIDVYERHPWWKQMWLTGYWVRPITRRLPSRTLYPFCERWVKFWWGITGLSYRLTGRRALSWFLCMADYRGHYPLSDAMHKEWSILDTFDMLSPAYDNPKTIPEIQAWFDASGLTEVEVKHGYNDIEARGTKPCSRRGVGRDQLLQ